jgi:hypothetical protein
MDISSRVVQFAKAAVPMEVTRTGVSNITSFKAEQALKACSSIVVTPEGMTILGREVHS